MVFSFFLSVCLSVISFEMVFLSECSRSEIWMSWAAKCGAPTAAYKTCWWGLYPSIKLRGRKEHSPVKGTGRFFGQLAKRWSPRVRKCVWERELKPKKKDKRVSPVDLLASVLVLSISPFISPKALSLSSRSLFRFSLCICVVVWWLYGLGNSVLYSHNWHPMRPSFDVKTGTAVCVCVLGCV